MERLGNFLQAFPKSPHRVSVLHEKATIEWKHGYFRHAVASLEAAWDAGRTATGLTGMRLAEGAAADLLGKLAAMGKKRELGAMIAELKEREHKGGTLEEALHRAKEIAWFLKNQPEQNVYCGFSAANEVCVPAGKRPIYPDIHDDREHIEFITNGLSLYELRAHSHEADGDLRILKSADPASGLPVPCIIHWDFGHYSAVTEREGDRYRIKDRHLDYDHWVPKEAIAAEASGYLLAGTEVELPPGYTEIGDDEAKSVFGRHCTHARDKSGGDPETPVEIPIPTTETNEEETVVEKEKEENDTVKNVNQTNTSCSGGVGMATYNFRLMNPGLQLVDTPLAHSPPYGPGVFFRLEYDQRSSSIPDLTTHANFGPRWTYDYLGYITLEGTGTPNSSVQVVKGNGNFYPYSYDTAEGKYTSDFLGRAKLNYSSGILNGMPGFLLRYADGSEAYYTHPDSPAPTRYYLTEVRDPQGHALTLGYDAQSRLVSLTDALGQVTTISYTPDPSDNVPADTTKIRSVTDPFGRSAQFRYTAAGQLHRIIDPVGIVSEFSYQQNTDFINALTTPYGTTTFAWGDLPGINEEPGRFIEATDPHGDKERAEANDLADFPKDGIPPLPPPTSVTVNGTAVDFFPKADNIHYRNTYYWDRQQMKYWPRDFAHATVYNWKARGNEITGILASMKRPNEARVWYNHPGQDNSEAVGIHAGYSKIVQAVEGPDGIQTWAMRQVLYSDAFGKPSQIIDPLGRLTAFEYNEGGSDPGAEPGLDLTRVLVREDGALRTVATYSDYLDHQPRTITDAAGQTTTLTYNANHQIETVTNAKGEVTTFNYYAADAPGKQRRGRVETIDGALAGSADVVTFDYDAAGNVARVTGPDGYFVDYQYDALDRVTRVTYPDGTFEETNYLHLDPQTFRDRLGRITSYGYDSLRRLTSVTDPANRTIQYEWCRCGDLRKLIDAMGRVTHWRRDAQGRVVAKEYTDGSMVRYAYEAHSGRLSRIVDEKGQAKIFAYNIDGTRHSRTHENTEHPTPGVTFTYDPDIARIIEMVDGIGTTTYSYNPLGTGTLGAGQLASEDGPFTDDTITYTYDELGRRTGYAVNGVGESMTYDELGRVVQTVNPVGTFSYTYDGATGRPDIVTYPGGMTCDYNYHPLARDFRLKDIIHTLPDASQLSRHSYEYDAFGNITRWTQISAPAGLNRSWLCGYDDSDQLTSVTSQDPVTLANLPTGQYAYSYDPAGNRLTETIDGVTTTASFNSLNQLVSMTTPGGASGLPEHTYEWDGNDRLIAINYTGTNERSEFEYDGLERLSVIDELVSNVNTTSNKLIRSGIKIVEIFSEISVPGNARFFDRSLQIESDGSTQNKLIGSDHLGSPRVVLDQSANWDGAVRYTPSGQSTEIGNVPSTILGFTGYWWHRPSNLQFAPFRTYDQLSARWLTRDPIGESDHSNLYVYADNSLISRVDRLGLTSNSFALDNPLAQVITKGFGPCCGSGFDCSVLDNPRRDIKTRQNQACITHDEDLTKSGKPFYHVDNYPINIRLGRESTFPLMKCTFLTIGYSQKTIRRALEDLSRAKDAKHSGRTKFFGE